MGKSTILAIDTASVKSGYAIYRDGKIIEYGTIKTRCKGDTSEKRKTSRLGHLSTQLDTIIKKHKVTHVVMEDIYHTKEWKLQSAERCLSECRGVVVAVAHLNDITNITYINPIMAKQHMWNYSYRNTLTRAQQKERMCRAVALLGYDVVTDDEADAIGIMITYIEQYCRNMLSITHPVAKNAK